MLTLCTYYIIIYDLGGVRTSAVCDLTNLTRRQRTCFAISCKEKINIRSIIIRMRRYLFIKLGYRFGADTPKLVGNGASPSTVIGDLNGRRE